MCLRVRCVGHGHLRLRLATTSELRFDAATAPNRFRFSGPPTKLEGVIGTLGSRPPLADVVCFLNRTQGSLSVALCDIGYQTIIDYDLSATFLPYSCRLRVYTPSSPVMHGHALAFAGTR